VAAAMRRAIPFHCVRAPPLSSTRRSRRRRRRSQVLRGLREVACAASGPNVGLCGDASLQGGATLTV
jgi:hypothetical protein